MTALTKSWIRELHRQAAESGKDPNAVPAPSYKLTDAELREKLEIYKEIIEAVNRFVDKFLTTVTDSPIMVAVTDESGHLLAVHGNEAIIGNFRRFGIVEGMRYDDHNGPSSIDLCLRYGRPVQLVGEDHYHKDLQHLACYSAPYHTSEANGTITIMTDVEGAHPHLLALLCTIADYAERELLLRRQNMQLQILNQALLHTPHYGVLLTDERGLIVELNDSMRCLLRSLSPDEQYGPGVPVFSMPHLGDVYREVIESGEERIGMDLTIGQASSARHYMLDVVPIVDAASGGSLVRVIGTARDITELRTTKERLHRAEKLAFAGQLAASVAHEIRNPLTTVKGLIQLSRSNGRSVPHHDLIVSEMERMNMIIGELLLLGKPQAVQFKEERCYGILLEVLEVFCIQAKMNGIEISSVLLQEEAIRCERNQIKQMFFNLLRNAMEALPYGGKIDVELAVEDGHQRIRISDNGVGMEEEVLVRLGEPFHTTKPDGNGLGLLVVRNIVSAHRGRIDIASRPGIGTTVNVYLPICY